MATNQIKCQIKVAVIMKDDNSQAFLGLLNIGESISDFMRTLCNHFKVDPPEDYGLQFSDVPNHYVLDTNNDRIKDGVLLVLVPSVARLTDRIVKALLNGNVHEKSDALQTLAAHSNDALVAKEFIKLQGMKYLVDGVEEDRFEPKLLGNALSAFAEMMDHGFIPWDSLNRHFIKKIVSYINDKSYTDSIILYSALTILESVVTNSSEHYELVENMITLPHLLHHIGAVKGDCSRQIDVQQYVLALVNALFLKAEYKKQKYFFSTLTTRQYRNIITNNIFQLEDKDLGVELRHQLYVLEQLLLNQYEERMMMPLDPQDEKAAEAIMDLRSIAFEDAREGNAINKDVNLRRMEHKQEFKKLGFRDDINPANDFMETPPGMLALDNMCYFARNHSDQYSKLVLENCYRADSHECPLGRAAIELTKLLCEILKVGEHPSEDGQTFHRVMYSHDHAFEEVFSICLVLFNKTWKEMKATTDDFSKVVRVSRVQIMRTLVEFLPTLDCFYEAVNKLTYLRVAKIWQDELEHHEEKELQAPPIVELTKQIKSESYDLIQQHRLCFLVDGTRFQLKSRSSKEKKFQYWRLSPNHKFLHFGSCSETSSPAIEELSDADKISISDIKDLHIGKDSHKKDKKYMYPFSILLEDNKAHEFDAPDELTFHYWQDGINCLLRRPMGSRTFLKDQDLLVGMELKLRLLDTEGVPIPEQPPPIPPLPSNFNFTYQIA